MADIRLQKITADTDPLFIRNGRVLISNTISSTSFDSGTLVVEGGIGILASSEGATIAGGVGIVRSMRLGDGLTVHSGGNVAIRGWIDGSGDRLSVTQDTIRISDMTVRDDTVTIGAIDSASVVVNGGVGVLSNTVIAGGASVDGKLTVGGGVAIASAITSRFGPLVVTTTGDNSSSVIIGDNSSVGGFPLSISNTTTGNKINLYSSGTGVGVLEGRGLGYITVGEHTFYAGDRKVWDLTYGNGVVIGGTSPASGASGGSVALDVNGGIRVKSGFDTTTDNVIRRLRGTVGGADSVPGDDIRWHAYETGVPLSPPVDGGVPIEGNSITWSPELGIFCAAFSHQGRPSAKAFMAISRDGIVWEYNEVSSNRWFSIVWSPELRLFCATGNNNGNVGTSRDGLTWTIHTDVLDQNETYRAVRWSPELRLFCVLNRTKAYTSYDGIIWTSAPISANIQWWSLCWSSELGLFCVVGPSGTIGTSNDGLVWSFVQLADTREIRDVIWCSALGKFYGIYRTDVNTVIESSDGVSWTASTISDDTANLLSIVWNEELSLLTVSGNGVFYTSRDGRHWDNVIGTVPVGSRQLRSHIWSPERSIYVVLRENTTDIVVSRPLLPNSGSALMANPAHLRVHPGSGGVSVGVAVGGVSDAHRKLTVGGDGGVGGVVSGQNVTLGNMEVGGHVFSSRLWFDSGVGSGDGHFATATTGDIHVGDLVLESMTSGNTVDVGDAVSTGSVSSGNFTATETIISDAVVTQTVTFTGPSHTLGNILLNDDTGVSLRDPDKYKTLKISGSSIVGVPNATSAFYGGVSITGTTDATNASVGGALTVTGGVGVGGPVVIDGEVELGGLETTRGVEITGDVIVTAGGMSIGGDLYVGGQTVADGIAIPKMTTGSLSIVSGFVIGGSVLVSGGGSIARDMYIGRDHVSDGVEYISGHIAFGTTSDDHFWLSRDHPSNRLAFNVSTGGAGGAGVVAYEVFAGGQMNIGTNTNITGRVVMYKDLALTVGGGHVVGDTFVGGDVIMRSRTQSLNKNSGALQVVGGVHVGRNMNVRGSLNLEGNLSVGGDVTYLNSRTITLENNMWYLNNRGDAPPREGYLGFFGHRFQKDTDTDVGDIIEDSRYLIFELPQQGGLNPIILDQIRLPPTASSVDDYYKGWWIRVASGMSALQVRRIVAYNGTTRIVRVSAQWNITTPGEGETVHLFDKSHVGLVFNETTDRFELASGVPNTDDYLDIRTTGLVDVAVQSAEIVSADASMNASTGALVLNGGGLSISNTTDATVSTSGGALTVMGGCGIDKSLHIGEKIVVGSVMINPRQSDVVSCSAYTLQTIGAEGAEGVVDGTTFDEDTFSFDMYVAVRAYDNTNGVIGSAYYHLRGLLIPGSEQITKTYVGDHLGIDFGLDIDEEDDTVSLKYTRSGPVLEGTTSFGFRWKTFTVGL
jgi:hypothetical protein